MEIDGRFWLTKGKKSFLGSGRIELLERIEKTGSISAAAKEMKMSYKAAWDLINSMNELADQEIIKRQIGGKGGGGTTLTPYAHELIETYKQLHQLHRQFIDRFSEAGDNPEHLAKILKRLFLTTSARNQILSKIEKIEYKKLNATISIELAGGTKLYSTITSKSVTNMNLHEGDDVYAIIKSSDIKIVSQKPDLPDNINILEGFIESIESNEVNSEIVVRLNDKTALVTVLNNEELSAFKGGDKVYALISFNNVIIGS